MFFGLLLQPEEGAIHSKQDPADKALKGESARDRGIARNLQKDEDQNF